MTPHRPFPLMALAFGLFVAGAALVLVPRASHAAIVRLGNNVAPVSEMLQLTIDPRQQNYSGTATIEIDVKAATDSIRMHADDLDLGKITLAPAKKTKGVTSVSLSATPGDDGTIVARAAGKIAPGRYTLTVPFTNDFDTHANALYKVIVEGESYSFTDFEPDDARQAWPCFDEPSFKIPWRVVVTVPAGDRVIANMPVAKTKTIGALTTHTFEETPPLSSYLIAVATGPLDIVPVPGMSIPGNIVTVKGRAAFTADAVKQMPPIVAALERYFDRPFPFPKCDLLAVPEFYAGAMENAGAVTFREEILLLDPKTATPNQRRRLAATTAHELAHMWFGDLVTLAWWDDVWLNESFASWLGDKITNRVFPQFSEDVRQVRDVQSAMLTDARPSTRVIRSLGSGGDVSLDRLFDPLAYQKGQAVLQMFESWIGPDVFREGVQFYIQKHEWGNATADDLWHALSLASGHDVGTALSGFITQPGVPLISSEIQPDGNVKLRQSRFHNYGTTVDPVRWQLPVLLKYEANGRVRTKWALLTSEEQTVALPDGAKPLWIDPNGNETGYYRWSIPGPDLVALAENATKKLEPRERVGFLANASALLDAGLLHGDEFLRIMARFAGDPEPEVGQALVTGLTKVRNTFVEAEDRQAFAAYVRQTLGPVVERIGRARKSGEPDGVTTLRPVALNMLGEDGQDASVLAWADSLGRVYRANPSKVDATLADVAVHLPATRGDAVLYAAYRMQLERAKLPVDRARWLNGLGSFHAAALVDSALAFALNGPVRPQERRTITQAIAEHKENQDKLYEWATKNRDQLIAMSSPATAAFLPLYASGCSAERLERAKKFFGEPAHQAPGVHMVMAQVSDGVTDCVGLKEREGAPVRAFLHQLATAK